ncbi:phosphoserine phosphatase [Neisseria arctica]|uniref:Phosphoserine phosphatase n=1 Tax=Neisseria arctica TaxID=1470200 RepID=A0A0J0YUL7_9NEIS|nr:phosphoserine phosphatase SerB [Neisseria arctica]KLT73794.1 phosphoserine phosphatase [Neisseria arctica]UOO87022.1 phosphoserine phosphatase SerB [Neisseria arctica]
MSYSLVLQHPDIASYTLGGLPATTPYAPGIVRIAVEPDYTLPDPIAAELTRQQIDFGIVPDMPFNELGLIVSDMDSTLITIECIDEIAAGVGLKDQVAEITESSMRGELDFEQSLRHRVALLKGLEEGVFQEVYDYVLQLSPGAEYLIEECKKNQVKFMLVSGGFTFFTDRLKNRLGLDYSYANTLEIVNGKLTGRLQGRIIDAEAKASLLAEYRKKLGLRKKQVLAMGDGANDIPMLQEAGIGIAYRAKPKTQQNARLCINHCGLEAVRGWFL